MKRRKECVFLILIRHCWIEFNVISFETNACKSSFVVFVKYKSRLFSHFYFLFYIFVFSSLLIMQLLIFSFLSFCDSSFKFRLHCCHLVNRHRYVHFFNSNYLSMKRFHNTIVNRSFQSMSIWTFILRVEFRFQIFFSFDFFNFTLFHLI